MIVKKDFLMKLKDFGLNSYESNHLKRKDLL